MKLAYLLLIVPCALSSVSFANVLTRDAQYHASLDIQQTQIADNDARFLGSTWTLEKPIGAFYGINLRALASAMDGFSDLARKKSLSLFYGGPVLGWRFRFHPLFGADIHIAYGFGTVAYTENTGTYDDSKNQIVKKQDSDLQFFEPAIAIRFGDYQDMQAILAGGTRILGKNSHPERIPSSALAKPFVQVGIIKKVSGI